MKGLKIYVVGIMTGILLSCGISFADEGTSNLLQCYKMVCSIWADGKEVDLQGTPILNYEGRSYLPLAKLGDLTGANITWDGDNRVINIKSVSKAIYNEPKEIIKEVIKEVPKEISSVEKSRYSFANQVLSNGNLVETVIDNDTNSLVLAAKTIFPDKSTKFVEMINGKEDGGGYFINNKYVYYGGFKNSNPVGLGSAFFNDGTIVVYVMDNNNTNGYRYTIANYGIIKTEVQNGIETSKKSYLLQ